MKTPEQSWGVERQVCDICGKEHVAVFPIPLNEDVIAMECPECGNMSAYPKEEDDG